MARGKKRNQPDKEPDEEDDAIEVPVTFDDDSVDDPHYIPPADKDQAPAAESGDSDDEDDRPKKTSKVPDLTPEQEQELAEFFSENPIFYNKQLGEFKNSKKKDRMLEDLGKKMDLTPTNIKLWFRSQRTMFGKLHRKKSGQARKTLTERQHWVLKNLSFLKDHIVHRPISSQLGETTTTESTAATQEEDEESQDLTELQSQGAGPSQRPQKKSKKGTLDAAMLAFFETATKQKELSSQVDEALKSKPDEKKMFMDFVVASLGPDMSQELWRDFTKDQLDLLHKYQVRIEREKQHQQPVVSQPIVQMQQIPIPPPPQPPTPAPNYGYGYYYQPPPSVAGSFHLSDLGTTPLRSPSQPGPSTALNTPSTRTEINRSDSSSSHS